MRPRDAREPIPPRITNALKTYILLRLPIKSIADEWNQFSVVLDAKRIFLPFSKREKNTSRVITIALNSEVKIPIISVVANPRIEPLPKLYRIKAVSTVVMFASIIAL